VSLPPLYAVLDADACDRVGREVVDVARAFLDAGVTWLQVRAKHDSPAGLLDLVARVVARAGNRASVIVNDRPEIAMLASAAGVHLGQDDMSVAEARALVGTRAIVGLSTHSVDQARLALEQPVSYLAIGPVFETRTKSTGCEAVGLALVRTVSGLARTRNIPVVAIGGITLERAPSVIEAGAASVCVISDLLKGDPMVRARQYLTTLGSRSQGVGR
jgi:thiamine-phosphate pyrophosphorylase